MTKRLILGYAIAISIMVGFLFAQGSPAYINSLSPGSVVAGSPDFALQVGGTNFVGCSPVVTFNGTPLSTALPYPYTYVTATVPAALVASPGTLPVKVASASCGDSNIMNFSVTPQPLSITTAGLPGGVSTTPYTATISGSGGTGAYSWGSPGGTLPPGLTFNGGSVTSATITGTPTTPGSYTFAVQLSDPPSGLSPINSSFTINVVAPLVISPTSPPEGVLTVPYNATFSGTGGVGAYVWSSSGTLPPGLTFNGGAAATATITGTPTSAGSYAFSVQLAEPTTGTPATSRNFTIEVVPKLNITTPALPAGALTVPYSTTISGTGGKGGYSWSYSGSLPPGLTFNGGLVTSATITGTPTATGSYSFTAVLSEPALGIPTAGHDFTIQVVQPLAITPTSPPQGVSTLPYSATFSGTGGAGAYVWSYTGTLPPGLTFNGGAVPSATITGTPTSAGSFNFSVQLSEPTTGIPSANSPFTINVVAPLAINATSPPEGVLTLPYNLTISGTGGAGAYVWNYTGTLPPGLNFNGGAVPSATITGTPTSAGNFTFSVQLSEPTTGIASANSSVTIHVVAPLAVSPVTLPEGVLTLPYNATFSGTGGAGAYVWSYTGTLPPGLTFNGGAVPSATITGTPTSTGSFNFSVQLSEPTTGIPSANSPFTINVVAPLAITPISPPEGVLTLPYNLAFSGTGGVGAYVWNYSGTLPPGLTFNGGVVPSATITGTPTAAGNFTFTVQLAEPSTGTPLTSGSFTIHVVPPLAITPVTLPEGVLTLPYNATISGTGGAGAYVWSYTGTLPPGLTFNGGAVPSATITGTPTSAGTYTFSVQLAEPTTGTPTVNSSFTIEVVPPLAMSPTSLPRGVSTVAYSATITASGGKGVYSWDYSGTLPPGLTLTPGASTVTIAGTPTTPGLYGFSVFLSATPLAIPTASHDFTINVVPPLIITTSIANSGTVNQSYSMTFATINGTAPFTWALLSGSLPAGLTLNPATGTISGTPTALGTSSFTLGATESTGKTANKAFAISIYNPALDIPGNSLTAGTVGVAYSGQIVATGGNPPITFRIDSGLPPGLTYDGRTGTVSGTPTQAGTFTFGVYLLDSLQMSFAKSITMLVNPAAAAFHITNTALPNGLVGTAYSTTFTSVNGNGTLTWSGCGGIPGLTLSGAGVLSGTPTTPGDFTCSVRVIDSQQQATSASLPLHISSGISITAPASLGPASVGRAYGQTISVSGGQSPYRWSAQGLPNGLSISTDGVLGGTPTAAGTFTVAVTVTDYTGSTAQKVYTLVVAGPLTITTDTLANGLAGVSYSQPLAGTGGTPPYTWSGTASGGLSITSDGHVTGTPAVAGPIRLTVNLSDSASGTVSKVLTVNVDASVSITTDSLPNGTLGVAYSATLLAGGGSSPYRFTLSTGSLPTGLTLDSTGLLSGQPTTAGSFTFALQATDANGASASRAFTVTIALPAPAKLAVVTAPTPPGPSQQSNVGVTLGSSFPVAITGRLTLSFAADTVSGTDDASVQFASGGRTTNFSVAAGSTQATFSIPQQAVQFGSTAGTITITMDQVTANGQDITPSPAPTTTIKIDRAVPVITSVTALRRSGGFDVTISGFSTPREITQANFHFTPFSGRTVQTADVTVNVTSVFSAWFGSAASANYGSLFTAVFPFDTPSGSDGLQSLTVTLTNSLGTSTAVSANVL